MLQTNPLTFRSRLLLLQLRSQCQVAQQQLRSCRPVSTTSSPRPAKTRTLSRTLQTGTAPKAVGAPPAKPKLNKDINSNTEKISDNDHTPRPLSAPLGLPHPPKVGQNTGIDSRTWRQRRADFLNYDKHLERRASLTKQVAKPYFREWNNLQYSKGTTLLSVLRKTFLSPPTLIRAHKALYFPNLHGSTLGSPSRDTTPLLRGKTSLVALFSGTWAEHQTQTFFGSPLAPHPALAPLLAEHMDILQRVDVNLEDNFLKASLIRLFMPSLRHKFPQAQHERYFLVKRGMTDEIRDGIGMLNSKVGYVYLLDSECRIRWAGSGPAGAGEMESLVKGVGRLVGEWQQDALRREARMVVEKGADCRERDSLPPEDSLRQVATG
ncbi:Mitochondrial ATPase complex subunit atp10 [Xylographa soralifera]|nr:Mitochondrial ATPase complex subunit atp10 [Xylographa soralifera]